MSDGTYRQENETRHEDAGIVLMLSLQLILLAFFILINSIAEIETTRMRAVLDSVDNAFNGTYRSIPDPATAPAGSGVLTEATDGLSQVHALVSASIPGANAKYVGDSETLRIDLPANALFAIGEDRLRASRADLVRRLARALMPDPSGAQRYEVEVLHGTARRSGHEAPAPDGTLPLEIRRDGALAQALRAQGLPAEALSIGLLPNRPELIRLILRARTGGGSADQRRDGASP